MRMSLQIYVLSYFVISIIYSATEATLSSSTSTQSPIIQCSQESYKVFTAHQGFIPNVTDGLSNGSVILLSTMKLYNPQSDNTIACREECCRTSGCNIVTLTTETPTNTSDNQEIKICKLYNCKLLSTCQLIAGEQDSVTFLMEQKDEDTSTSKETLSSTTTYESTADVINLSISGQSSVLTTPSTETTSKEVISKEPTTQISKSTEKTTESLESGETMSSTLNAQTPGKDVDSSTKVFSLQELSTSEDRSKEVSVSTTILKINTETVSQQDKSTVSDNARISESETQPTFVDKTTLVPSKFSADNEEGYSTSTTSSRLKKTTSKNIQSATVTFNKDVLKHLSEAVNPVVQQANTKNKGKHIFLSDEERMAKDKTTMAALLLALIIGIGFMVTITILFLRRCGDGNNRRIRYTRIDHLMNAP